MPKNDFSKQADILRFLADSTRLKIIDILFNRKEKGMCVNDISKKINASHSAVSHQLSKIEAKGLAKGKRDGNTMCYRISKNRLSDKVKKLLIFFED